MKYQKNGFTLIEMMISITIFFILALMAYVNYAYQQNVAKVRLSVKEVSQSISEARNMAINGFQLGGINQSIGVYFDKNNPNSIQFFSYNHNFSNISLNNTYLIKERKLQKDVEINKFEALSSDNVMIFFQAITGEVTIYTFDSIGNETSIPDSSILITVSYKTAGVYPLKRELTYYKKTDVIDY